MKYTKLQNMTPTVRPKNCQFQYIQITVSTFPKTMYCAQVGDGVFEVLSTSGDTHLGGDDFDRRIVDSLADEFQKNEGVDLRQDRQALQRLTEAAEKAKVSAHSV